MNISSGINDFAKRLIDEILDNAEDENIAWNWGEETLRVDYIINLINDLANMEYKRPSLKAKDVDYVTIIIIDIRKVSIETIVSVNKIDAITLIAYLLL